MIVNGTTFEPKQFTVQKEFELVLKQITACYKLMLSENDNLEDDERKIRNQLYKDYLTNNNIQKQLKLSSFFFQIEVPYVDDLYEESGRHDFRVFNPKEYFKNSDAYFIIECKRLNGTNTGIGSLTWEYVENGIDRFKKRDDYPSYYKTNGMIGFIVKSHNIFDIVTAINTLLIYTEKLVNKDIIKDFDYCYLSEHKTTDKKEIELYHLMFDFSSIIRSDKFIS